MTKTDYNRRWYRRAVTAMKTQGHPCSTGCGKIADTLDHIVPLSKGGAHHPANLQPMCKSCNSSKGAGRLTHRSNRW